MTQEQIHPNEEEMRINHETLCRIREWAIFMDGSRYCFHEFSNYTNTFEYHEDRASWIYSKIRKTMKSVGLAFFLGNDFKLDHADHIALRRYARQCFCIDILIGLMFPIAPFIRLRYCSNLMMLEAAKRCVERHDMQSSKAFADCAITSSTVSLPMSKNGQLARHDCMQRNKSLREIGTDYSTLRMTPTTLKGNPAKNSDINFASAPSLLVDSVLTPGQQQKMKSSGGWYYLLGDDSNNNNNNIIQIPPPGAHPRRHRGSEIVYQPYDSLAIKNTVNTHSIDINQKETEKGPMNSSLFLPKTLLPSLTMSGR
ncbi:hypothetical protein FBU30_006408 [Linnemannia zychae]|nr:hypothetical protein FBU30_006408 [Linnemannia zychae]